MLLANNTLRQLQLDHSEVFQDELGTITPFKAQILVSSSAVPRFHRPRPVPYALQPLVELELDRLTQSGVLESVSHSDWAAPIVTMIAITHMWRLQGDCESSTRCGPVSTTSPRGSVCYVGRWQILLYDGSLSCPQSITPRRQFMSISRHQHSTWLVRVYQVAVRSGLCSVNLSEDDEHHLTRNGRCHLLPQ